METNNGSRVFGRSTRITQGKKDITAPEAVVLFTANNLARGRPWSQLSLVV